MSDVTKIAWCDSTFNGWIGCTKVGPGCDNCYAERDWDKRRHRVNWGAGNPRSRTSDDNWKNPIRWNKKTFCECENCGWRGTQEETEAGFACPRCVHTVQEARRRVFCSSLSDWLDNEVPIEWLADLLDVLRTTPKLDWLMLSKRIGAWKTRLNKAYAYCSENNRDDLAVWILQWLHGFAPDNIWVGATVVNQDEADRDIQKLLRTPAMVRFLSLEPLLGDVDFNALADGSFNLNALSGLRENPFGAIVTREYGTNIDWVIVGGESRGREFNPEWARSVRDQCQKYGAAFFMKQMAGTTSKALNDIPEDLMIREFPR